MREVSSQMRERLLASATPRRFERGAVVLGQGESFAGLLVVRSGRLVLNRRETDGRLVTLRALGPDDCYCLTPGDAGVGSAVSIECVAPARVLVIDRECCEEFIDAEPALARGVMRCLAERANAAIARDARPVANRVIEALVELADRDGVQARDGVVLNGLRQDELAAHAGTVREVAARTLGALRRDGIIRTGRACIVVCDIGRLRELATAAG